MKYLFYMIPSIPFIIRFIFVCFLKEYLSQILPETENDRSEIRSYVLTLSGFSFTALVALSILEPNIQQNIQFSIYYAFLSFLFYLFALNLQGYKNKRWHDVLSDTLLESASLCLILTVIGLLFVSNLNSYFVYGISAFAIIIWLIDFIIRLNIQINHLSEKDTKNE
ncbi:MAG: hypothetical protein KF721_09710 [Ignavibacteriaceae bacterium]|nr:hypothetical protein [Ignavibacteriaceae bacterium]